MNIAARPHDFPWDIAHTALLIIDMQYDFVHPDGYCCRMPGMNAETASAVRRIIPHIAAVRAWADDYKVPVIYTRESHRPDLSDVPPAKRLRYANAGYPIGSFGPMGRYLVQGEPGNAIIDELVPRDGDLEFDKPAQSAFVETTLDETLRAHGLTHLLLTGVTTQCCVLATYRQASDLGYFPLLLEDCCAAFDAREHDAAVTVLTSEGGAVGWVTTSAALLAATA